MCLWFPGAKPAAAAWLGEGVDCSALLRFRAGGHLGRAFEGQCKTDWCGEESANKGPTCSGAINGQQLAPSGKSQVVLFVHSDPQNRHVKCIT